MLRPRIIVSLLIHEKGLVKTVRFKDPKYIGDPINAVKIFNEKEVDELAIFDIDATVRNLEPSYDLIEKLANQSRMPICYGGGVKTVEQARKIFNLGVEKIAFSSSIIQNLDLVREVSEKVGSQSVVVVLDVKKKIMGGYEIYTHNGRKRTGLDPLKFSKLAQESGAGEIVINSIDNDGVMNGFDLNLVRKVREVISVPFTALGGAGSFNDIEEIIANNGIMGVAAGSLFVFTGKYKAVLINYPDRKERDSLLLKSDFLLSKKK